MNAPIDASASARFRYSLPFTSSRFNVRMKLSAIALSHGQQGRLPWRYATIAHGHIQRRQRQFGPQVIRHRPTHHAPAESVQDHGQKNELFVRPYISDVRHPKLV
jgi:hypothetical protein